MKLDNKQELHSTTFLLQLVVTLTIGIFILFFWMNVSDIKSLSEIKLTGSLGDTLNGLTSPFIMLLAAYLTFKAFKMQFDANEMQRKYILKQRFEDNFFRLIESLHHIVESIDINVIKIDRELPRNFSGTISRFYTNHPKPKLSTEKLSSRDCFKSIYNRILEVNIERKKDETIDEILISYSIVQDEFKSDLHHYFRLIYRILKYIDNSELKMSDKYEYAGTLRALFSPYELGLLYYNGLHSFGKEKFKPLIEKYCFLKNLDKDILYGSNDEEKGLVSNAYYHEIAFLQDSKKRNEVLNELKNFYISQGRDINID